MPAPSVIEVILKMTNVGAFVGQAEEASKATTKVGKSAETAGKSARLGAAGLLKYAAGAAAVYGAVRFIDKAVTSTEELTKSTYALQQQTGMSAETSSEWIAMNEERGLSAKAFSVTLQTLSKQMEKARGGDVAAAQKIAEYRKQIDLVAAAGGKDAPKQLAKLSNSIASAQASGQKAKAVMTELGVPLSDLRKGNTGDVLLRVADAFKKMRDPATRAADAQLLFGRSGRLLIPVLSKGRDAVQKMLDKQKEAGNYLTQKQVRANLEAIKQQKELSTAVHGLETQLSIALLPILIQIGKAFMWFADVLRPITSNSTRLKVVIYGLAAAFGAYKTVLIATWLWEKRTTAASYASALALNVQTEGTWLNVAATKAAALASKAWAVVNELLSASMYGIPIVAVVAGVVALGVAIYEAYKHVGWFHKAVDDAWHAIVAGAKWLWNWLRSNWPLIVGVLTGPFGIAAALIYRHFDAIKSYALGIVQAVRTAIQDLVRWVESLPGKLGHILKKIPGVGLAMKAGGAVGGALSKVGLQHGGTVTRPGGFLVGERGPELVTLPAGSFVRSAPDTHAALAGGRDLVITVPVMVDRRVIARSVARVASDQLARR
jgi:hypothetical protein